MPRPSSELCESIGGLIAEILEHEPSGQDKVVIGHLLELQSEAQRLLRKYLAVMSAHASLWPVFYLAAMSMTFSCQPALCEARDKAHESMRCYKDDSTWLFFRDSAQR